MAHAGRWQPGKDADERPSSVWQARERQRRGKAGLSPKSLPSTRGDAASQGPGAQRPGRSFQKSPLTPILRKPREFKARACDPRTRAQASARRPDSSSPKAPPPSPRRLKVARAAQQARLGSRLPTWAHPYTLPGPLTARGGPGEASLLARERRPGHPAARPELCLRPPGKPPGLGATHTARARGTHAADMAACGARLASWVPRPRAPAPPGVLPSSGWGPHVRAHSTPWDSTLALATHDTGGTARPSDRDSGPTARGARRPGEPGTGSRRAPTCPGPSARPPTEDPGSSLLGALGHDWASHRWTLSVTRSVTTRSHGPSGPTSRRRTDTAQ